MKPLIAKGRRCFSGNPTKVAHNLRCNPHHYRRPKYIDPGKKIKFRGEMVKTGAVKPRWRLGLELVELVYFGVVVAVGILHTGDHLCPILDFQVGLEDFNMHLFALCRKGAGGACVVQSYVAIVRFEKFGESGRGGHDTLECRSSNSGLTIPQ